MAPEHYAFGIIDGMTQAVPEDRLKLDSVLEALAPHLIKDNISV